MEVQHEIDSKLDLEAQVRSLYDNLLMRWNSYDADEFASLFTPDGNLVGYDGSQVNGRQEIKTHLRGIFDHHQPASFISIIREVRPICTDAFILRAVTGMVPPGQGDLNPKLNSIQTLIASKEKYGFCAAVFQTTPAAFHGSPELREVLTCELRGALLDLKVAHQHLQDE